jgi:hypothetical protein
VGLTDLFLGYEKGVCFHTCVTVATSDVVGIAEQGKTEQVKILQHWKMAGH